jgi:NAD(P)H-dependent FMN reductase
MHYALISGSHRQNSQSSRVATYLAQRLQAQESGSTTDIINLAGNPLPLWDESAWQAGSALQLQWQPYSDRLKKADGLVVIAPEWAGMVPPGLKNFFLFASPPEVGHKPALIVTVSASRGGSYPVEELRISSYKNNKIAYLPEHLIVQNVDKKFATEQPVDDDDKYLRGRADFALRNLIAYTGALKSVRDSGVLFDKNYPFGM